MLRPTYDENWPSEWKTHYAFDLLEIWGDTSNLGYTYAYQNRREPVLNGVMQLVPKGGAILDVAGGNGSFTLPLAEQGYRVTWNDIRPDQAGYVKQKYEYGEVEFAPGNVQELAGQWAGRFDAVIATEVIEHVAHPDQFLAALAKVTRPGGTIFITTPNGKYFRNDLPKFSECKDPSIFESKQFGPDSGDHIFLLHPEELISLGKTAGLSVERLEIYTNPLTAGHVKLGYLLPILPRAVVMHIEQLTRKLPRPVRERISTNTFVAYRKPSA